MTSSFDATDVSLFHLIFIGNSIERTFSAFAGIIGKVPQKEEYDLFASTSSLIIIETVSFLHEYNRFLRSDDPTLHSAIVEVKRATKPALVAINQWTELEDFRNHALAHNLRNKRLNVSVFERGLTSYNVPQYGSDLHVMVSSVGMIKEVFESAFRVKITAIRHHYETIPIVKAPRRYTGETCAIEIEKIRLSINDNITLLKTGKDT